MIGKTITKVFIYANDNPNFEEGSETFVFCVDEVRINGLDIGQVNGETGATVPGYSNHHGGYCLRRERYSLRGV